MKNIDSKIKKIEKDEKNLARLISKDFEDARLPSQVKKVSGVMLLSNRLYSRLPISETMQNQLQQALSSMRIKTSELHASQKVLDEFENLRELLIVYFSLDKYIE